MYDHFRNEVLLSLADNFNIKELKLISKKLDEVAYNYDITQKETSMIVYNSDYPKLVKTYLVCKKIEGLSNTTLDNYGRCLKNFFFWLQKSPENVITNDIRIYLYSYQNERKISNRTLEQYRQYISHFFTWAFDEEYITKNPSKSIKAIKFESKPRQALTQIELEYIRKGCSTVKDRAIVEMLYSTGCRVSELANLKKSDIDWDKKSIHLLGKGNKHRTSFINAKAEIAIKDYLSTRQDNNDSLFVSDRKPYKPMKKDGIEKIVRKISKRSEGNINKKVTPHILRHTTATIAIQNGMPVEDIKELLGHTKVDTTMIYAKTSLLNVQAEHKKYIV